jgi:hypothetical protein
MKMILWISFYLLAFLGMVLGMYYQQDMVIEQAAKIPFIDYNNVQTDVFVEDSTYYHTMDSLAYVVEGLLGEMAGYAKKVNERDHELHLKERELNKLKQEVAILRKERSEFDEKKIAYNKQQEEKKLQSLASTLSTMKADVLRPILENMDDEIIKVLYDKAKQRDRVKIFNALESERAGKILNQIAKNSN